jgi:hypothetical protein
VPYRAVRSGYQLRTCQFRGNLLPACPSLGRNHSVGISYSLIDA